MKNYFKKNEWNDKKLVFLAILLIAVLVGLFWLKNNFSQNNEDKKPQSSENNTLEKNASAVSSEKVKKAINNETYQIIDIREKEFFDVEHIESSINIPLEQKNPDSLAKNPLVKEKEIFVVDENGSEIAQKITANLSKDGYNVKFLEGGIEKYRADGFGTISFGFFDSSTDKAKVNFINNENLLQKIKAGEKFVFLDVRKKENFSSDFRIEGSVNIPLEILEKNKREIPIGKIVVVDESPIRSFQGAVRLYDMNILAVYCLEGKLSALREFIESQDKEQTQEQE